MKHCALTLALTAALGLAADRVDAQSARAALPIVHGSDTVFVAAAPALKDIRADDVRGKPYQYGVVTPAALPDVINQHGRWQILDDGRQRWTWSFSSPGAQGLELHLANVDLPASAVLRIYGSLADGKRNDIAVRTLRAEDVTRRNFRTALVDGERAYVELDVDARDRANVAMDVDGITHSYRSPFDRRKSADCNRDIACAEANGWQNQVASVGMYTLEENGATYGCSGAMIGNKNGTSTPYFITANHCVSTNLVADTVTVYWNYESQSCRVDGSVSNGTPLNYNTYSSHNQTGATLRATHAGTDTTLLQLDAEPAGAAMVYYAGWSRSTTAPTSTTTVHHAYHDEKRIARDNQAPTVAAKYDDTGTGSTHWRLEDFEVGITELGSSGAPLFNPSGQIVGVLSGGYSSCSVGGPEWFGRISSAWTGGGTNATRLRNWLDPATTNSTSIAGYYQAASPLRANTANVNITDLAQVQSTINVSGLAGNGSASSRVKVRLNHTYIGDLIIELVAPDGSVRILHNNTGGGADNLHKIYTVNLSTETKNGLWTLRVSDTSNGDTGMIDYWSIKF